MKSGNGFKNSSRSNIIYLNKDIKITQQNKIKRMYPIKELKMI